MIRKISKSRLFKITLIAMLIAFFIYFIFNCSNLINKSTDTFMVENGTLSYEEETVRIYYKR